MVDDLLLPCIAGRLVRARVASLGSRLEREAPQLAYLSRRDVGDIVPTPVLEQQVTFESR
jgi:hypothetical protein